MKNKFKIIIGLLITALLTLTVLNFLFIKIGNKYYYIGSETIDASTGLEPLSDKEYSNLMRLKKVVDLRLYTFELDDAGFLRNMPELESLDLARFHFDLSLKPVDINYINSCKKLQDIDLFMCGVEDLSFFSDFEFLNKLCITGTYEDINFLSLKNDSLESIYLDSLNIKSFDGIENVPNLKSLSVFYMYSNERKNLSPDTFIDLSPISALDKLDSFELGNFPYKFDIESIKNSNIKKLHIYNCQSANISSDSLLLFNSLEELNIRQTIISDFANLKNSKSLKSVIISPNMYSEDDIEIIRKSGIEVKIEET